MTLHSLEARVNSDTYFQFSDGSLVGGPENSDQYSIRLVENGPIYTLSAIEVMFLGNLAHGYVRVIDQLKQDVPRFDRVDKLWYGNSNKHHIFRIRYTTSQLTNQIAVYTLAKHGGEIKRVSR